MGEAIDRLAKLLASGGSRRAAIGSLLTGAAILLPRPIEASRHRRKRTARFQRFQQFCEEWCDIRFGSGSAESQQCIASAKDGKGPCYSSSLQGPGYFCTQVQQCGKRGLCCPRITTGDPVTDGECCTSGEACRALNSTVRFCVPA